MIFFPSQWNNFLKNHYLTWSRENPLQFINSLISGASPQSTLLTCEATSSGSLSTGSFTAVRVEKKLVYSCFTSDAKLLTEYRFVKIDSVISGAVTCKTRFTRGRNDQQRRCNLGDVGHLFKWRNDNIKVYGYSKKNQTSWLKECAKRYQVADDSPSEPLMAFHLRIQN